MDALSPYSGHFRSDLDDATYYFNRKFTKLAEDKGIEWENSEMYEKAMNDFVYSFLVRKFALADGDYGFHNVGLIHDTKNNSLSLAPNFDFEYSLGFYAITNNNVARKLHLDNLKFAIKHYPKLYEKFSSKFNEFVENRKYESLVQEVIGKGKKSQVLTREYSKHLNFVNDTIKQLSPKM